MGRSVCVKWILRKKGEKGIKEHCEVFLAYRVGWLGSSLLNNAIFGQFLSYILLPWTSNLTAHFQPFSILHFRLTLLILFCIEIAPLQMLLASSHYWEQMPKICFSSNVFLIIDDVYIWLIEIHLIPKSKSKIVHPNLKTNHDLWVTVYLSMHVYFNVLFQCMYFLLKRDKNILLYNWIILLSDICWQSLHVTIHRFSGLFKE